jgi:hypothetical protein
MLTELIASAVLLVGGVVSPALGTDSAVVGRIEIILRDADVVFSRADPLDNVVRVSLGEGFTGARVDVAAIELTIDVDDEASSFVPFMLVAQAVELDTRTGEYRAASPVLAREPVQQPGAGQEIRMIATGIIRYWAATGEEAYLRIYADEPVASDRPADSIRFVSAAGSLGKIVLLAR